MILATSDELPAYRITKVFGLVRGNTIRARSVGRDLVAILKGLIGGEIEEYTKLLGQSREQALDRMTAEAEELGANAIVAIRFTTSEIMSGAAEIMVYGTAVHVEPQ
jgi:uncharacterized protein YbjQ (UPF0145 family)